MIDVESREGHERLSGSYGIVLIPDQAAESKAIELASRLAPEAEYRVSSAHITLYHARFDQLPTEEVRQVVRALSSLRQTRFTLRDLQIYGGKFLFWNIVKDDAIQQAHEHALGLGMYLDKSAQARALQEGLSMGAEEMENLRQYGHPLVHGLYLPHITLAYDSRGLTLPQDVRKEELSMGIYSFGLAEIGDYGSVKRIVTV